MVSRNVVWTNKVRNAIGSAGEVYMSAHNYR